MLGFGITPEYDVTFATMGFSIKGAKSTEMMVQALEETRDHLSKHCGEGKLIEWCYPQGTIYTFW
jgi:hypothetical protein